MKTFNRLMAVDDETDITFTLKIILEKRGFSVDVFNDPQTAIVNLKPNYYDLILLDLKMPRMNGFELYQRINQIDAKAKVCVFTAYDGLYDTLRKQFPNLKSECLISKPINILNLIKRIDRELNP